VYELASFSSSCDLQNQQNAAAVPGGFVQKLLGVLSFLFLCLPAAAQNQQTIRVNAGGPAYRDTKGHAWSADYGFNTGSLSYSAPKATVTGTSDPTLFKSARVGTSSGAQLEYHFKVSNGRYRVNLYFAETYFTKAGKRVFDVQLQGATLFSGLDIFAQAGRDHALVRSAQVSVTSGQLVIRFVHHAGRNVPVIGAVEILPSGSSTPPSVTTQPASQSITVGQTATFKVVATGTAPLSYQWMKRGANIAGATSASYTTPAATSADNGSTFQVKIKNSAGQVTSTAATLTINSLLTLTTTTLPGGTVGKSYLTALHASSGTKPYSWKLSGGTLPAGLSLVASTGVISGKPTTTGIYNFTANVTDTTSSRPQTATKSLSITIAAVVTPLHFSTSSLSAGQVGVAYSTMIQATGGTTPYHWSIDSGALPAGLTLSAATGMISGKPTKSGSSTFTAKVTDLASPSSQTATRSLTITVASAAAPVQITTTSVHSGQVGVPYSTTLIATDGTLPYKWSIASGLLPAGVTLGAATGTIAGTPTTSGTLSFTIHVTDSASPATTDSANFSITIAARADHSVMLKWTASPSPGVTGYNVYRSTTSGSGYSKINPSLVGGLSYTDASVVNGQTYYYVTTAVNAAGDESSYSVQVKMIVP
jgi:hypothetical protein